LESAFHASEKVPGKNRRRMPDVVQASSLREFFKRSQDGCTTVFRLSKFNNSAVPFLSF
jgi:hypothetical protein